MLTQSTAGNLLRAYCDAFRRRAGDEIENLFAEDAVLDLPLLDGRVVGKKAIVAEVKTAIRGLKNIKVILENTIETDTEAFAEGIFYADHIGIHPLWTGLPFGSIFGSWLR